jgi:hypothetical protein
MYLSEEPNGSPEIDIDWSRSKTDHIVQWYRKDAALVHSASGFVSDALRRGGAAIVIGTEAHRNRIEERLEKAGIGMQKLQRTGRYIFRDAEETLSRFMVNGSPDAGKFFDVVGTLVSRASNSWSGVRAFGEMVGVLWQKGQPGAAIELENLWHRLIDLYSLPLFCAYPKASVESDAELDSFSQVCDAHTVVIL